MTLCVHQPQYLPWLGYFDKIIKSDCFVFLDKVQYKHREFQNRNKIRTKDGWIWLTVPVVTKGLRGQAVEDVEIDNSFKWQDEHLKSLKSWYSKAEFFKEYIGFFEKTYLEKSWGKLTDLNIHIIKYILEQFNIDNPIYLESEIGTACSATERIIELCKKLKATKYLSGQGGKDYLDEKLFAQEGIELLYQEFKHPVYRQCFSKDENDFLPYMCVVDLLFNEGPKSREILIDANYR